MSARGGRETQHLLSNAPPPPSSALSNGTAAAGRPPVHPPSAAHPHAHVLHAAAPRPAPSAAQQASALQAAQRQAAAAMIGSTAPAHLSSARDDTDGYEVSDSELEDSVVMRDGRRFPNALKEKHVSWVQLLAIVYLCVVGGPYGLEDAIRCGGVSWVCLLLVILPWTLNLPIGLLTSELASAMPQNGGYILWVARAFGNFWGFLEGWFSWSSGLFDTALYPFLVVAYASALLTRVAGVEDLSYWAEYGGRVGLSLGVMLLNLLNVQMQGAISLAFACACLLPFAALTLIGLPQIAAPRELLSHFQPLAQADVGLVLAVLLWVGSGWDAPGTVAGDVKTPKKSYPRAVTLSVALVMLTNLLPVVVAWGVVKDPLEYVSGDAFWAKVALSVGGVWLQVCVIIAGVLGNLNLLHVLLTSSSWSLYALALPGLLDVPYLTRLQSHFRTPWVCIVVNTVGLLLCCLASFTQLIQVTMALNGLALILQCMALVWLRISAPRMKRPYRIPLSTPLVAAFMFIPCALSILLLCTISRTPQLIVLATSLVGVVAFLLARLVERLHQVDTGQRPTQVDLQGVFEDVEAVVDSLPSDEFPDLGFRSSLLVEQLPESITGDPTEHNDNYTDKDSQDPSALLDDDAPSGGVGDNGERDDDDDEEDTAGLQHLSFGERTGASAAAKGDEEEGAGPSRYGATDLPSVSE